MKRVISILLIVIFASVIGVSGQKKTISYAKFKQTIDAASKVSSTFPRRHRVTEETLAGGVFTIRSEFLWEAVSQERTRRVERQIGPQAFEIETVEIGEVVYERKNGAEWTKRNWYYRHGLTEQIRGLMGSEEYWQEEFIADGKRVKLVGEKIKTSESNLIGYRQEEYWIDIGSGKLMKIITTHGQIEPPTVTRKKTFIYDYDPNIKIEAPIK